MWDKILGILSPGIAPAVLGAVVKGVKNHYPLKDVAFHVVTACIAVYLITQHIETHLPEDLRFLAYFGLGFFSMEILTIINGITASTIAGFVEKKFGIDLDRKE